MENGLRRYEAVQRLLWFLFFLFCLAFTWFFWSGKPHMPSGNFHARDLRSFHFWYNLEGIRAVPVIPESPKSDLALEPDASLKPNTPAPHEGKPAGQGPASVPSKLEQDPYLFVELVLFLVRAAAVFLIGKFLWLVMQYSGKALAGKILGDSVADNPYPSKPDFNFAVNPEALFPRQQIMRKIGTIPAGFLFHAIQRVKIMLSSGRISMSSEELIEKERRIVESDWQVLGGSWTPFNWLVWLLPVAGLSQTAWLIIQYYQQVSAAQKELADVLVASSSALLPFGQAVGLVIVFRLAAGLLRRFEDLYLSGLDALIYDRLLSKIPFHSADTAILLDVLQRQFQQLHAVLRRLERTAESKPEPQR